MGKIAITDSSPVKAIELHAIVHRACPLCGTGNPAPHNPHGKQNEPWSECPTCGAKAVTDDRGVIAFWHSNPFVRLWHWVKTKTKSFK